LNDQNGAAELLAGLPPGALLQRVAFTSEAAPGQTVLLVFPAPVNRTAVVAADRAPAKGAPQRPDEELLILAVPAPVQEDADLLLSAREWADPGADGRASQVVSLQGAQIVWAPGRAAVLAAEERLDAVRKAVIEAAFYDSELRSIERELGGLWPDLEADAPLAFEFNEKSVRGRRQLAQRFQRVLLLRARLARITPHVLSPHVHPPTLASQVGERLRERARFLHRVEAAGGQLEVFERVYEACGQRASDFMLARTGHLLEWGIIVLLFVQTILVVIDLLSGTRR
jgi:hypothetical protein